MIYELVIHSGHEVSAKLGMGIDEAVRLAAENEISGVNKVLVVVSADATSRYKLIVC